jgi:hypothetical protein
MIMRTLLIVVACVLVIVVTGLIYNARLGDIAIAGPSAVRAQDGPSQVEQSTAHSFGRETNEWVFPDNCEYSTSVFPILLPALLLLVVYAVLWLSVFEKAGYSMWLGLLAIVPVVNFIALIVFALIEWPVARELRELKEQYGLIEYKPEPESDVEV